jgi:DNA-binding FadR family transcriptional regulator
MSQNSLSESISARIRDEILRGRYRAGDRLPSERELALRFNVHRGAVREALKKIEQLGLAEIRPGGTRVNPIEEASLDVIQHLIALSDPPDPEIGDLVLEVFSSLFAFSARLSTERADASEQEKIREVLAKLQKPDLSFEREFELVRELSAAFVGSSRNMVLSLIQRAVMNTRFLENLHEERFFPLPSGEERAELIADLLAALETQDGRTASEAIYSMANTIRKRAESARRSETEAFEERSGEGGL